MHFKWVWFVLALGIAGLVSHENLNKSRELNARWIDPAKIAKIKDGVHTILSDPDNKGYSRFDRDYVFPLSSPDWRARDLSYVEGNIMRDIGSCIIYSHGDDTIEDRNLDGIPDRIYFDGKLKKINNIGPDDMRTAINILEQGMKDALNMLHNTHE